MVKQAKSKCAIKPAVAASSEGRRRGKESKQCHLTPGGSDLVYNDKDVPRAGPVQVNDPTLAPSVPKSVAHDIWHFFLKGKDGSRTVCKVCQYISCPLFNCVLICQL
jgi:hypothetical protein